MECWSCGDSIDIEDDSPTHPRQHLGLWRCYDCWDELANGRVNVVHMHTARLYSAGSGCPLEPNDDAGPWQENAIRDLEE